MNRVEILTEGPISEGLGRVVVADDYANDTFTIDYADLDKAKAEGQRSVLDLVVDNSGEGAIDILSAAVTNGSPVTLDGAGVDLTELALALEIELPKVDL